MIVGPYKGEFKGQAIAGNLFGIDNTSGRSRRQREKVF